MREHDGELDFKQRSAPDLPEKRGTLARTKLKILLHTSSSDMNKIN